MKEFFTKHKVKIVLVALGGVLYAGGLFLGIDLPLSSVFEGDLSSLGAALEGE